MERVFSCSEGKLASILEHHCNVGASVCEAARRLESSKFGCYFRTSNHFSFRESRKIMIGNLDAFLYEELLRGFFFHFIVMQQQMFLREVSII